jgi:hypothetical protein
LEKGETLWLSSLLLTNQKRTQKLLPALRERYEFGRLYGSLRAADATRARRLAWGIGSLILPAVLVTRVFSSVVRKRRHLKMCLLATPYIVLFSGIWSWGELVGYLSGRRGSQS